MPKFASKLLATISGLVFGAGLGTTTLPGSADARTTDETEAYERAVADGSPEALQGFLEQFPTGLFARDVFSTLNALIGPVAEVESMEDKDKWGEGGGAS